MAGESVVCSRRGKPQCLALQSLWIVGYMPRFPLPASVPFNAVVRTLEYNGEHLVFTDLGNQGTVS